MKIIEDYGAYQTFRCDCGWEITVNSGEAAHCPMCGVTEASAIGSDSPTSKAGASDDFDGRPRPFAHVPDKPVETDGERTQRALDAFREARAGIQRCAICSGPVTERDDVSPLLRKLCGQCIEMIQAINVTIEEMVARSMSQILAEVMTKLRGKGHPGLVRALLEAFKLQERL